MAGRGVPEIQVPRSVQSPTGSTALERRVIENAVVATAAPATVSSGFSTGNHRFLHVVAKVKTAAASADLRLWLFDSTSQEWTLYPDLDGIGNADLTVTTGTVQRRVVEIQGASRAHIQVLNPVPNPIAAGPIDDTKGLDVWLSTSTY